MIRIKRHSQGVLVTAHISSAQQTSGFSILRASSQDSPGGPSFIEGFLAAECVDANGE